MTHHQLKNCQFRIKLLPSVHTQDSNGSRQRSPSTRALVIYLLLGSLLQFMISHKATDSAFFFFMRVKMYEHLLSSLHVLIHVSNYPVQLFDPSLQMRTRRRPATCLRSSVGDGVGIWAQSLTFTPAGLRNSSCSSLPSTFQSETTNPQGL